MDDDDSMTTPPRASRWGGGIRQRLDFSNVQDDAAGDEVRLPNGLVLRPVAPGGFGPVPSPPSRSDMARAAARPRRSEFDTVPIRFSLVDENDDDDDAMAYDDDMDLSAPAAADFASTTPVRRVAATMPEETTSAVARRRMRATERMDEIRRANELAAAQALALGGGGGGGDGMVGVEEEDDREILEIPLCFNPIDMVTQEAFRVGDDVVTLLKMDGDQRAGRGECHLRSSLRQTWSDPSTGHYEVLLRPDGRRPLNPARPNTVVRTTPYLQSNISERGVQRILESRARTFLLVPIRARTRSGQSVYNVVAV